MNKFYVVDYQGLYLQMNSTGHVFTVDLNSANRFESKHHAFDWVDKSEEETYKHLLCHMDVIKCELVNGEWEFTEIRRTL